MIYNPNQDPALQIRKPRFNLDESLARIATIVGAKVEVGPVDMGNTDPEITIDTQIINVAE